MSDEDVSPWVSLDDVEAEIKDSEDRDEIRRKIHSQVIDLERQRDIIEGRVLRPGEPSPGMNQTPYVPEPEGKRLMMMPLEGRPMPGGTYAAFVLDGPRIGQWAVEHDHWRAVEVDHRRDAAWYATTTGRYMDESVSWKQTVYRLQRLEISSPKPTLIEEPGERRQYWFWSSVPVWEMDPAAAVFLLIDAEPWQTQMCRVPDRH